MTKQDMEIKMNGWTFEETVKTAENLMESERNMFRLDTLRHLRENKWTEFGYASECVYNALNEAVEIVKGGGVNGKKQS